MRGEIMRSFTHNQDLVLLAPRLAILSTVVWTKAHDVWMGMRIDGGSLLYSTVLLIHLFFRTDYR